MKLTRIDIRSLPGIHRGFRVDGFDLGANFVTGPNAIGKSSLVRALSYLLREPRSDDPRGLSLSAEFRDGDTLWAVHREGSGQPIWERDGHRAEPPPLPTADAIASHLVTVEDLVRIQGDDETALATALRRELQGGFDLQSLRNGPFERQPRIGNRERSSLESARSDLRAIEITHAELRRQQETLPGLAEKIDQARAAGQEVERLNIATDLLETERLQANLERELAEFPEGMDKLGGKEIAQLDDLEQRIERHRENQRTLEHELQQARTALADSGLAEQCPGEQELELARDRLSRLESLEGQITEQRASIAGSETRRDNARARLGGKGADIESMPKIEAEAVDRARELAREFDRAENARDEYVRRLEALQATGKQDEDPRRLRRGADLLRDWLSAPAEPAAAGYNWKPGAIVGGIGAAAAVTGGLIGQGWMAVLGGVLMLIAVVLPFFGRRTTASQTVRTDGIRESYLSLQIDEPASWERQAVLQRLRQLDDKLAELKFEETQQQQASEWQRQLERAERELTELETRRQALGEELGFDPALLRQRDDFLQRVRDWQQTIDEVDAARTRLSGLESEAAELRAAIGIFLGQYPGTPDPLPERHDELVAAFRELRQRSQSARDATAAIQEREAQVERLREELAAETEARARLYRDAGLEDGQRRELEQRLDRLDEWRDMQQNLDQARRKAAEHKSKLEQRPDLIELAASGDADEIARRLRQASERHERLDELRNEKIEIESDIRNAEKRHDREAALAEVQACESALVRVREGVLDAEAAHFLLDQIENEYQSEQQPRVLESAREHFGRFTHHLWRLELDESDQGSFRALDTEQQAWRQPGELSTATRMQLLLALRLAHAEASERDTEGNRSRSALPLLIDEALTTSDHERASVILQSLEQVAEQGRQVIYLAASESEYQLWQHATGQAPNHIDLGEIRGRVRDSEPPSFVLPERQAVPAPEGRPADEYARLLDIPAINPYEAAGSVHVFHLLYDQLEVLHQLMACWRVRSLGQLENLLETEAGRQAVENESLREQLARRCRSTREWIEAWRIGRGKLVDREALERAAQEGILNKDRNIEGVAERAAECRWQPAELIEALKEPITWDNGNQRRLSVKKLDEFRDFLVENDYLDERDALTAEERRQRVLTRLSGIESPETIHEHLDWLENAQQREIESEQA